MASTVYLKVLIYGWYPVSVRAVWSSYDSKFSDIFIKGFFHTRFKGEQHLTFWSLLWDLERIFKGKIGY